MLGAVPDIDGSWGRGKLLFTRKEAETSAPVYFLPPCPP